MESSDTPLSTVSHSTTNSNSHCYLVCYLPHQQHQNNCARKHTTQKYLKELDTSQPPFLTRLIH